MARLPLVRAPGGDLVSQDLKTWLLSARRAGAPLLAVSTPDQPATVESLREILGEKRIIFSWSCFLGLAALNAASRDALRVALGELKPEAVLKPEQAMKGLLNGMPKGGTLIMLNAPPFVQTETVRAAFLTLREAWKENGRTLILLGQSFDLPAESRDDFVSFSVPLPTEAEVERIVTEVYGSASGLPPLAPAGLARAKASLVGLKAFGAEQAVAMSLSEAGLDQEGLGERKRQQLAALKGITVPSKLETYADVAGGKAFTGYMDRIFAGPMRPRLVVQVDEAEKMISSTAIDGDNTGVAQEIFGLLLPWLSGAAGDKLAELCAGVPGTGKSLVTRAVAGQHGVPCAIWNLADCKESLVGASTANVRRVLDTFDALAGDRVLLLFTANNVGGLKPEFRRRITHEWMFDLPDESTQAGVWDIWMRKLGLAAGQERPETPGWSGADIAKCCRTAKLTGCSLIEAATYTVPYAVSAADSLAALRKSAEGKFIDANRGGTYRAPSANDVQAAPKAGRKINLGKKEDLN